MREIISSAPGSGLSGRISQTPRLIRMRRSANGTCGSAALSAENPVMLLENKRVRHPGDVIADHPGQRFLPRFFLILERQVGGAFLAITEKAPHHHLWVAAFLTK